MSIDVNNTQRACALEVKSGATLNLTLAPVPSNSLKSGALRAGLEVPTGATLTIGGSGNLSATGGSSGAGIGGNYYASPYGGGKVIITGGAVKATGGSNAAGIGGAFTGEGGSVTVSGGSVTAIGGENGAGIGGGYGCDGGTVSISGGTVTANGGGHGAGIGGGTGRGSGGTVSVTGGVVEATGGGNAAGIGGGDYGGSGGNVTITGGTVKATGGWRSAGIGGGLNGAAGSGGSGGTVNISGGSVSVTGGPDGAAGIGGGCGGTSGGTGGTVTISGGTVIANGSKSDTSSWYGAGIGAALNTSGSPSGSSGSFSTGGPTGNAFVLASSISDTSKQAQWGGVIFPDNNGKVYGTPTLAASATIPGGKTLVVDGGKTLTIASGVTLTNDGAINNAGAILNHGSIENSGSIDNAGSIENHGTIEGNPLAGSGTLTNESDLSLRAEASSADPSNPAAYGEPIALTAAVAQKPGTAPGTPADPAGDKVDFSIAVGDQVYSLGEATITTTEGTSTATFTLESTDPNYSYVKAGSNTFKAQYGGHIAATGKPGLFRSTAEAGLTLGAPALTVEGGALGTDYTYASGVLTVLTDTPLTIGNANPGTATTDHIAIAPNVAANVTLSGVDIDAPANSSKCALELENGASLALTLDGDNLLKSGSHCAGLQVPGGASLSVRGAGSLSVTGGDYSAGIGGGNQGSVGTISVSGGTVVAVGGSGGAGIGGGLGGPGGTVAVSGGAVAATGGAVAAPGGASGSGIGPGLASSGGSFSTADAGGSPGNAFIVASSIADTSKQGSWSGVIFGGDKDHADKGQVYGQPTLALDATIPAGKTLDVPAGSHLSLGDGVTLTNDGTIENHGGITGSSSLAGNGKITSDAKVTLTAESSPVAYGSEVVLTATVTQAAPTPGSGAEKPTGTMSFAVVKDGSSAPLGDPVPLTPNPSVPGAALAALTVKAFGDDWAIGANDVKASYSGQGAAPNAPGLAQADGHLSLQVEKGEIHPSVSISGWTYGQSASSPSVDPATNPGGGAVSYAYKPQGVPDSAYISDAPQNAGAYTVRATVAATERYAAGEATADFAIAKADQVAPVLTARAESISGKGDGAIEDLTTAMEWAASGGDYQPVVNPDMTFTPGTYQVRLAADADHDASPAVGVTIEAGHKLKVTLPAAPVGYTLTADKATLDWHESATLAFKLADGYTKGPGFAVKATGAAITPGSDGSYSLSNAEGDVTVAVEGVKDSTAPAVSAALGNDTWDSFDGTPGTAPAVAGAQTLSVGASDAGSGLDRVEYLLSATPFATADAMAGDWMPVSMEAGAGTISLPAPGASYVYVRATDKAGNAKTISMPRIVRYNQPALSSSAASFEPAHPADVSVQMTLNGNAFAGISVGGQALAEGADYAVSGSTVEIKAPYLAEQAKAASSLTLTFSFDPAGVAGATPKPTAALTIELGKVPIHPTVSIAGWTYGQSASSPSVDPATNPGHETPSYTYKPQGAAESDYSGTVPTEAGSYTVRAQVPATDRYAAGEATADFTIAKADQAAPVLTAQDETVSGKGDSGIEGLTTAMEWAASGGAYQPVADPNIPFLPGAYQVRLAADANHNASPAVDVTIEAGDKLKVTLPADQVGCTLTADKTALIWHGSATLTFKLADGYTKGPDFAVKVNEQPVSLSQDGTYVLSNAETDMTVTVEGVVDSTAPAVSAALGSNTWDSFSAEPGTAPAAAGTQTLTVKASDLGSGLAQVDYLLSATPFASVEAIQGTWEPLTMDAGEGKIELSAPGASYVYVRAADEDGNSSVVNTPRIVRYVQPALSSSEASFDPAHPADVSVQMTLNDNAFTGISAGGQALTEGADYTVDGNTVTIKASYLTEQAKATGSLDLTFSFDLASVPGATPKPTATLTITLGKVPIHPSVSIEGWTFGQAAKAPVLGPDSNPGNGNVVYEYKKASDPDASYKADAPTEAGSYTLCATVGATERYAKATATADFTIAKADQAAPVLTAQDETVSDRGNGRIEGLTTAMEWAASGGAYQPVVNPDMPFMPKTYQVRLAADANHNASPATEVTVAPGPKLKVSLPANQTGYTLTADKTALNWHGSATLTFTLADGYTKGPDFAVKATGAAITPGSDGSYILSNAEADVVIAVEGVAPEFTQQTVYDGSHDVSLSGMLTSGARLVVTPLPSGGASFDALSQMALAAGQDVVGAYEAKLIGRYEGRLRISFKVDGAYEGQTLTVYHQKDAGGIETLNSTVLDGCATVEVDGLSPFLVAAPSAPGPAPQPAPQPGSPGPGVVSGKPAPQPGAPGNQNPATLAPQTGDALPLAPLALAALLSGAMLVALAVRDARRLRRRGR